MARPWRSARTRRARPVPRALSSSSAASRQTTRQVFLLRQSLRPRSGTRELSEHHDTGGVLPRVQGGWLRQLNAVSTMLTATQQQFTTPCSPTRTTRPASARDRRAGPRHRPECPHAPRRRLRKPAGISSISLRIVRCRGPRPEPPDARPRKEPRPSVALHRGDLVDFNLAEDVRRGLSSLRLNRLRPHSGPPGARSRRDSPRHVTPGGARGRRALADARGVCRWATDTRHGTRGRPRCGANVRHPPRGVCVRLRLRVLLVGTPAGLTRFAERLELGLFSADEYRRAFDAVRPRNRRDVG